MIHPTAQIDPKSNIATDVQIGAYCKVEGDVLLENGVILEPHVTIQGKVTIRENTHLYPFSHIGNSKASVTIGRECHIREFAQIGVEDVDTTPITIDDHCYIMAYVDIQSGAKIQENCTLTNHVVLGKGAHCQSKVVIGAKATVADGCTIGTGTMIGGVSAVKHDIPPFCLVEGNPDAHIRGLNLVGMRRGFEDRKSIFAVKQVFRELKKERFSTQYASTLYHQVEDIHAKIFVKFVSTHKINN